MKRTWMMTLVAAAGLASTALSAGAASAATVHPQFGTTPSADAVFVQTDNPSGNSVVAYDRTASGGLAQAGTYATGGDGAQLSGSVVDHTASEGSVAYDKNARLLYVANAGSNTITVFAVNGDRLERRQVISSGGQFPVSITAHGGDVYVLNAEGDGSISGFVQVGGTLLPVPFWHRDLGLGTTSSTVFTGTPGQVSFTPDGEHLVVTTKAAANTIDVFSAGLLGPSAKPTVTSLPNAVPFGLTFDQYGHLAVAEAGPNAVATFSIARDGKLTQLASVATGQAATCWITAADGKLYASNAGSATESVLSSDAQGDMTALGAAATDAGTVDATASSDGQYLYVQTGKAGDIDAYRINADGSLTETGSVTVPNAVGAEGIAAE